MSFNNLYYKRTAGTAKACFVCYKPTTTVLATINTVDFLYTCPGHLSDSGFATLVKDEEKSTSAGVSEEEIARVKLEWEEKQKKRAEKEKDAGTKDNKDADQKTDKDADKSKKEASPKSPSTTPSTPATHERYILHRNFFTMRQAEHRRRKQAIQAKELRPRLPSAPTGGV